MGTTGVCDIFPRVINGIPSLVKMEVDIRDIDGARRDWMLEHLANACADVARRRGVSISKEFINRDDPATCDARVIATVADACDALGIPFDRMVSRAYHDSSFMARVCPTAMIFIPCRDGVSHRPDEYASPEAIDTGVQVLAETLARLAA